MMCFDLFSFLDLSFSNFTRLSGILVCFWISFCLISEFRNNGLIVGVNCKDWGFLRISLVMICVHMVCMNLISLAPFSLIFTAHFFCGMAMGVPFWLACMFWKASVDPSSFIAHFCPVGAPLILTPLLSMIEAVSEIIRPMALVLRLGANMTAGHILCGLCSMASVSLLVFLPYEFAVAWIQSLVFCGLLSIFST